MRKASILGGLAGIVGSVANVNAGFVQLNERFNGSSISPRLVEVDLRGTNPEAGLNTTNQTYDFITSIAREGGRALMVNELIPSGWKVSYTLSNVGGSGNNIAGFFVGAGMDDPIYDSNPGLGGIGEWNGVNALWGDTRDRREVFLNLEENGIGVRVIDSEANAFEGFVTNSTGLYHKLSIGAYTGANGLQNVSIDNLRIYQVPLPSAVGMGALGLAALGTGRRRGYAESSK